MAPRAHVIDTTNLALQKIAPLIHAIRGEWVILDSDLAAIFGVTTARLNQQVRRNVDRFPTDFMFELTKKEFDSLMLQVAISKGGRGGRRKLPLAFTEHGAIMAANVLSSKQAVEMSVFVVRAFVKLRETLATHQELAEKLTELERKVGTHGRAIVSILTTIRMMTEPATQKARAIGFRAKRDGEKDSGLKLRSQHARKK